MIQVNFIFTVSPHLFNANCYSHHQFRYYSTTESSPNLFNRSEQLIFSSSIAFTTETWSWFSEQPSPSASHYFYLRPFIRCNYPATLFGSLACSIIYSLPTSKTVFYVLRQFALNEAARQNLFTTLAVARIATLPTMSSRSTCKLLPPSICHLLFRINFCFGISYNSIFIPSLHLNLFRNRRNIISCIHGSLYFQNCLAISNPIFILVFSLISALTNRLPIPEHFLLPTSAPFLPLESSFP